MTADPRDTPSLQAYEDVERRARRFRADDPDPDTQAELDALLALAPHDPRARAELHDRFSAPLRFGTAGLRGLLGAGDNRMNRRVVAQTTAALCAQLRDTVPDAPRRGVCVGFDGRHKSRAFAAEVQAVANGAGFVVHAFEAPAPTPLLAFAVRACGAAAGVMITASHNPAQYNGYKVYWQDGAQLNTPHDVAIARRLALDPDVHGLRRLSREAAQTSGLWHSLAAMPERYLAALSTRLAVPSPGTLMRVAYTALHGVGETCARAALQLAGASEVLSVAEQASPDPDFPTVRFPNPEEPGALDRVIALATEADCELALANDPDADRLAVAVVAKDRGLVALNGNELGVLLCDYLLARAPREPERFIVTTLVSTPLAQRVANAHGARTEITLTGFKWIVQRALARKAQGLQFVLGFEEALGYCIGDFVRDKDGVATAAHVVQMAQWHRARGRTLWQALQTLYVQHGLWQSRQVSIALHNVHDASEAHDDDARGAGQAQHLQRRLAELRRAPPRQLAGLTVHRTHDLSNGPNPEQLPVSDVLVFELEGDHRVTIRPSGTEPKLKLYLDCTAQVATLDNIGPARAQLTLLMDRLELALRTQLAG